MTPEAKRIMTARTALLLDNPFFGVLSLGLHIIEDPTCDTAWTNGQSLGYSPTFVASLNDDELKGLIAHEVMHCACGHPWRRSGRDPKQWNIACDYVVNGILLEAGFTLPADRLHNPAYAGRWSEWIYDRLPKDQQQQHNGSSNGSSSGSVSSSSLGEVRDAPTDADAPTEADWQAAKTSAIAAGRGKLPGSLQSEIGAATAPTVDWRSLLRRYVQEITKSDYTWSRPNVRYVSSGLYLPSLYSRVMGKLAIAIDTSGSIDDVLLQQFAGEVGAIVAEIQPSSVDVLYCDAKVHRVDHYEQGEPITLTAVGRGGTAFAPVFDALADDVPPVCLIYFTDLDGSFPDAAPDYPVIWCATGRNQSAPFGDVVECK